MDLRDFLTLPYISRPESANNRSQLGHWEGDTIRFRQQRKSSITTLVDRSGLLRRRFAAPRNDGGRKLSLEYYLNNLQAQGQALIFKLMKSILNKIAFRFNFLQVETQH